MRRRSNRAGQIVLLASWLLLFGAATPQTLAADEAGDGLIASPEQGWPQWRGPRRDGVSDEKGLLQDWPGKGPRRVWQVNGLGRGWSSPIVTGGRVYVTGDVGDALVIRAYDTEGEPVWETPNGRAWKGSYPGARATCAFSDGRVYHMNAHGRVVCLEAASGEEIWAVNILERFEGANITWALSECLLVDGPRVIVTPGGKQALMAALDKRTGATLWTTPPPDADRPSHASPILFRYAGRRVVTNCSATRAFGVDADSGELLWEVPLKNPHGANVATPVYGSGSVYYVTPYAELGRRYRLHSSTDGISTEHLWTCELDTVTGGSVLVDGTLFAAGYNAPKWWFALDWETGETKYELKDFSTGAAIYADQRLYCLDERGNVGLLEPSEAGFTVRGRFSIDTGSGNDVWAHPVLLDGRLYIRQHDTLYCYDVRANEE